MEQNLHQQELKDLTSGGDEDAPSPKDIYVYLVILLGALLVTAWA